VSYKLALRCMGVYQLHGGAFSEKGECANGHAATLFFFRWSK